MSETTSETTEDIRMPLTSQDVLGERVEQLRELFPEAFSEGEIDFERLRNALGDFVGEGRERYGLSWAGKADAIRALQAPSVGTLLPCPDKSVNWDTTENVFIEGDNLEVLKLLQKSYYGKVKMIYIDPPYNTGNEFIYPDNFKEGLDDYLKYSGQVDDEGLRLSTNAETSGRYHSKWLDMLYPRLFLARNLLRRDGCIFISIDDHEVHNLRLLMDEIFGSENFVSTVIWQKVFSPKNTARHLSEDHDYVVLYARDAELWTPSLLPRTAEMEARYTNPDDDDRGSWTSSDLSARNYYSAGTYAVKTPSGRQIEGPPPGRYWTITEEKFKELDGDNRIWWGADGDNMPRLKRFLSEVKQGTVPQTLWKHEDVGHTQEAKKELNKYAKTDNTENVLNSVKPTRLIQRMLQIATSAEESDIVLDFFAGSAATGHAVLNQNLADDGNRRFVLVQLPEQLPTPEGDLKTIFDLGMTRLRNRATEITDEQEAALAGTAADTTAAGIGCRVFKLSTSNFKVWDGRADAESVRESLALFSDHLLDGRTDRDILYEMILKAGLPLVEPIEEVEVADRIVHSIAGGLLLVSLAKEVSREFVRGLIDRQPQQVIVLDVAFNCNDELKTNTVLEMKSHGIEFRTV